MFGKIFLSAEGTPNMVTISAVDDVRAARLCRDVVRTAVALMAEPMPITPFCSSCTWDGHNERR